MEAINFVLNYQFVIKIGLLIGELMLLFLLIIIHRQANIMEHIIDIGSPSSLLKNIILIAILAVISLFLTTLVIL